MFRELRRYALVLALIAGLVLLPPQDARAAGVVTNCNDSGPGSLRAAIATAASGETITFQPGLNCTGAGAGPITLTSGTLTISTNLTIDGTGATITADGNNAVTLFTVASGVTANLNALTIQHGSTDTAGGGIVNGGTLAVANSTISSSHVIAPTGASIPQGGGIANSGNLTLTNTTVSGNSVGFVPFFSGTAIGGGIYNTGMLTLTNATISGNGAGGGPIDSFQGGPGMGGGIYNTGTVSATNSTISHNGAGGGTHCCGMGGGIVNGGTMTLTSSTVSGNLATSDAGIRNGGTLTVANSTFTGNVASQCCLNTAGPGGGIDNGGMLSVTNSTFTGNSASAGGGILNGGTLAVTNSTFSGNSVGNSLTNSNAAANSATLTNTLVANTPGGDLRGAFTGNNNLVDDGTISNLSGSNNFNQPALLGTLGNYGGPTQTIPLLLGSPAIDAGATGGGIPATDQRGKPRVGAPDIGAFESQGFTVTIVSGDHQSAAVNTGFATLLRVTIAANNPAEPVPGGVVTYTVVPVGGAGATLIASGVDTSPVAISPVVDASEEVRVLAVANGTAGSYTVVASAKGATGTVTFHLTNTGPLVSIAVTPVTATLKVGQIQKFTAIGTYRDGRTQDLTGQVQWAPEQGGVARVDSAGAVTGESPGTVPITATFGGTQGQATVTVGAPTPIGISVPPIPASRSSGATSGGATGGKVPAPIPTGR